jgi:Prokaryotic Cytochrome C oxidase subunit IV
MIGSGSGRRVTAVWLVLLAATLFSWESARSSGDYRLATSAVLLIAFLKARLIGLEFMELRTAPLQLRLIFEGWTVFACIGLLAFYWWTPSSRISMNPGATSPPSASITFLRLPLR